MECDEGNILQVLEQKVEKQRRPDTGVEKHPGSSVLGRRGLSGLIVGGCWGAKVSWAGRGYIGLSQRSRHQPLVSGGFTEWTARAQELDGGA